jgi:hypothetical protein
MNKKVLKISKAKGKVQENTGEPLSSEYPWLTSDELRYVMLGGYFDSEGVLHDAEGGIRCTSMVKSTGKRCKNFTVPGDTCCRVHGGQLARAKAGKERLYSNFIADGRINQLYKNLAENQENEVLGIREELGLLRALLAKAIDTCHCADSKEVKTIAGIIGEIRKLVSDCTDTKIRLGQLIDIGKVTIVIKQLASIIERYVSDKNILERIAHDFDAVTWPSNVASTPQPPEREHTRALPAGS